MFDDARNIYISIYDVLDMLDALYGDMLSMMIFVLMCCIFHIKHVV